MGYPVNPELLQGIARGSFFAALQTQEAKRIYPKICTVVTQEMLTQTYVSFGGVPEPRQLSAGATGTGGARQAKQLGDFKMVGTVVEWEDTVMLPRAVIETNPAEIPRITADMAKKASLFMDRRLVATVLEDTSTAGYDTVALFSTAHPESGTNQSNLPSSVAAANGTKPTAAELESQLDANVASILGFTDDTGSPVNEGTESFYILVPTSFRFAYKAVLDPTVNIAAPYYDQSVVSPATAGTPGSGRFRGMFEVISSNFVSAADRHFIFAKDAGDGAVALLKNKDWDFASNVGDNSSDEWRLNQNAIFTAYARWQFIPWNWKNGLKQVWT